MPSQNPSYIEKTTYKNGRPRTVIHYNKVKAPLLKAIRTGDILAIEKMGNDGVQFNNRQLDIIPLAEAVELNNIEVIKTLLKYNANPHRMERSQAATSPYYIAAKHGRMEALELLFKSKRPLKSHILPMLQVAAEHNQLDVLHYMNKHMLFHDLKRHETSIRLILEAGRYSDLATEFLQHLYQKKPIVRPLPLEEKRLIKERRLKQEFDQKRLQERLNKDTQAVPPLKRRPKPGDFGQR